MGGRGELDRQEHGTEVAFELRRQGVYMVPVKGGFIDVGCARQIVGNAVQLVRSKYPKGVGPDLLERRRVHNPLIRKQVQHVARLLQRVVALGAGGIHALLGYRLGVLRIPSDVMDQTGDQVVMEALIAVDDKAEQIEVRGPHREPFELIDGVIADQGRIIRDAFVGNLQHREHALRQCIQGLELGASLNFPFDLTGAEIFGVVLELRDGIQPWRSFVSNGIPSETWRLRCLN